MITYKEYNEKYRLPEQERDEHLMMQKKHYALCYEPGKGKSYPVIHCLIEINKIKNGNAKVLIMSDATCIKEMWRAEIVPQNILPKNTYMVTDRTAIGAVKEALVNTKWDVIIADECFHPETMILTASGWKYFYELEPADRVAQYNDDGTVDFVVPIRHICKEFTGKLEVLDNRLKVTPNHNMYYFDGTFEAAKYHSTKPVLRAGYSKGNITNLSDLDRLAIACQADGCCHPILKDGTQQWDFKFTKERKQKRLLELLNRLNLKYTTGKYMGNYYIKLDSNLNISKNLNTYFTDLSNKSASWCNEFILECSKWDGHIDDKGRFYYSSKVEDNTKLVQSILTLGGWRSTYNTIIDTRWTKICCSYRVVGTNKCIQSNSNRTWTTFDYSGKVYCVEVPSHKIIVRDKSGLTYICGNCQSLRSGVTRAKSKYAKLVYALTKRTEYVFGMTGTIAGNNNIEPFCVLHNLNIAGCGDINCHAFKTRYCVKELQYGPFGAFEKPVKLNEAGEALMEKAFAEGCSFWDYDENDEMPPLDVHYKTFKVPATETYNNAIEGILKCGDNESTVIKAIALQKAQQALNGFIYYDVNAERHTYAVPEFKNPKLDYVVEECKKANHIIAYRFQEDGYYITKALQEAGLKTYSGISEFKKAATNGEHCILVLQCSKGKSANLQICQKIKYYTGDFSFINYKQFMHRCWRRGQTIPCEVEFLVNDPGDKYKVEYKIWQSLQKKQSVHDTLMAIKKEV